MSNNKDMKTFLIVFAIISVIFTIFLLKLLNSEQPKFQHKNRIIGNWREGGWLVAGMFLGLDVLISVGITKTILWFNLLEKIA